MEKDRLIKEQKEILNDVKLDIGTSKTQLTTKSLDMFSNITIQNENCQEMPSGVKEVRVCVMGNVDSGKSTLVGVLTRCVKDDGRGSARNFIFNFKHEKESGRTSSIGIDIIGFKGENQIELNLHSNKNQSWSNIVWESDKIITILDLCGHEKFLKTTLSGLTGLMPDYAMIVVGANMGIQRMTKEHLGVAFALKVPVFVVVTKIDLAPENIYKETMDNLLKILKCGGAQRMPVIIRENDDVKIFAEDIIGDRVCPIFPISSVTGVGLTKLKLFLSKINSRVNQITLFKQIDDKIEFIVDKIFKVDTVGTVVSGTLISGTIKTGQDVMIGPDKIGNFFKIKIKSIQFRRTEVIEICRGNSCSLSLKSNDNKVTITKNDLRKGMVILDTKTVDKSVYEFEGEVLILHHATTIKAKYQAVIHCGNIRQIAKVVSMNEDLLRTGDKGIMRFRFLQYPEFIHTGSDFLFREGRTKGLGKITKLFYE